jgi:hypothetical protein
MSLGVADVRSPEEWTKISPWLTPILVNAWAEKCTEDGRKYQEIAGKYDSNRFEYKSLDKSGRV